MIRRPTYERDRSLPETATVRRHGGIAWRVLGWHTEPTEETEWSGIEERTGRLVCVMVGDDRRFTFDPDDVQPIAREDYCGECGQIGCTHDGLDREDDVESNIDPAPFYGLRGD